MTRSAAIDADLSHCICLVTGANSGIGFATARGLVQLGAHVILACRSAERGARACDELERVGPGTAELRLVDLARPASIRGFAQSCAKDFDHLDVLVNNAGIWSMKRLESPGGVELTWATNQLGYFLLTRELRGLLRQSRTARIVNVASQLARDLDLKDVEFKRRRYTGITAYAQSKQANRMFTWALARRLEGPVTANALHPGGVATPLFGKGGGLLARAAGAVAHFIGRSPADGADTALWLAASPEVEGLSDRFWIDRAEVRCRFRDPEREEHLWSLCESMIARES